jgi:serine/threonine-protein kinase
MSDVPLRSDLDRMVERYLTELALALHRLPVSERDHLLTEIREHIAELRAERPARDAWDMETLLNRVGLPEDIAAAALENVEDVGEEAAAPPPAPAPAPAAPAVPAPAPATPEQPRSRRTRLLVGVVAAAIVLVVAVSVAATRHGDVLSRIGQSSVVPATPPVLPPTPARTTVPDVIGMTLAQATADLQAAGLGVASVSGPSSTVPTGEVFSQSPAGGSFVPAGSTVTLDVSSGQAS